MTNALRYSSVWAGVSAILLTATTAAAQQATTGAASAQTGQIDRYVVGQATPPETPGQTLVNMSLEEAINIALENNLDLKVARMNPQGVDYQLQGARAAFTPRISGSFSYTDRTSISNNTVEIGSSPTVTNLSQSYNSSLSQTFPWWGSTLSLSFNNGRSSTDAANARLPVSFSSDLSANFTLPLLADRKIDSARNSIRTLQVQRQIVDIQLLTTIENTKANVRQAYWQLRGAIEQIEIQRRALELAQRQLEDNKIRVEIGTMAQIETLQSETQVVNAEQALVNAEITWRTAELNLKRLLANSPEDALYRSTLNPIDLPAYQPPAVDARAAITAALAERTDITQARRSIDVSRLNLELTENATLPTLDMTSSYRLTGTGATYSNTLGFIGRNDAPTWSLGVNFNYPIGMQQAKANLARAQLQLDQSLAQLQAQELSVSNEVYNAGLAVENTYKQLQVAIKAADVAEQNAEAEQVRFDVGMSNNYNVAQALNNLTNARLTVLSRTIAYINAVAEFDRVQRVGR